MDGITLTEFSRLQEWIRPRIVIVMHPLDATMAHRHKCQNLNVPFHTSECVERGKMLVIDLAELRRPHDVEN